jgi:molybdopterin-guanine dinucleotide biosynthesis protein B
MAYMQRTNRPPTFEEVIDFLGNKFDFILIEGFKESTIPRIEVHRKELGGLMSPPDKLLAVVTDEELDIPVPQFSNRDGVALLDLLEKTLVTARSGAGAQ